MSPVDVLPNTKLPGVSSCAASPPAAPPSALWIHIALFVLTLLSTTLIGMRYMDNYTLGLLPLTSEADVLPFAWIWQHFAQFPRGLPFSLTLLSILLAHEFGHYFACRLYGVRATLPYLLPAPTLSGTAGALIRLRSRVTSRTALLVIGASGPIAGFAVVTATAAAGLALSKPMGGQQIVPTLRFHAPLAIVALHAILHRVLPSLPPLLRMVPHPMLVASWIGLLITSLNLIPAGQLDGGHILYALSPRAHRVTSQVVLTLLLVLGAVEWVGWILWAAILLLPGMRHPKVLHAAPLDRWTLFLPPLCLLLLLLSGTVQPFTGVSLASFLERIPWSLRF